MARKWIQEAIKEPGALRRYLERKGEIKKGEPIPMALLERYRKELKKKIENEEATSSDLKLYRRVLLAIRLKRLAK